MTACRLSLALTVLLSCTDRDPITTDPGTTTDSDSDSPTSLPTDGGDASATVATVDTGDTGDTDETGDTGDTGGPGEATVAISVARAVDILFVIDNSGSMAEEQQRLVAGFPALADILEADGATIDYRIGFTTTDSGNPRCPAVTYTPESGNLVLSSCVDRVSAGEFVFIDTDFSAACTAGCALSDADLPILPTATALDPNEVPRKWLERTAGQANFAGDNVADAFACYAPQGVAGCGLESHLESMYLALAKANNNNSKTNYGFLRDGAALAIAIVSDETDCSYNPAFDDIFTTNKVFWNDPDNDAAPTSAMCWRAGVACEGAGPDYDTCHSENHDSEGNPGASDDAAVLTPMAKYIEFVGNIQSSKQNYDPNARVIVSLIAGVPIGYDSFDSEIQYADAQDPEYQSSFGIGPGCIVGPPNMPDTTAVPPVREREFAEAFNPDELERRNVSSICDDDLSSSLADLGQRIRDQLRPSCMPSCVADSDPATPVLEPSCTVYLENLIEGTQTPLPACEQSNDTWAPPAGQTACVALRIDPDGQATPSALDDMSPACVDDGFNLEFLIVRTAPLPPGTTVSAACELSDDKAKDCPKL